MNKTAQDLGFTVQVEATADVTADLVDLARQKVAAVGRYTSEPILFARVGLSFAGDRAVKQRALAQATLDWNGRTIRAHTAGSTMREAIDALQVRLRDRLLHGARNWEALRDRRTPSVGSQWRHGAPAANRPDWIPRPADEREVVPHEPVEYGTATPDEAAFDLEMLDHCFLPFREHSTGQDSILYKTLDGYGLVQLAPDPGKLPESQFPLLVSPNPAPVLSVAQAIDRLDMTGLRFVFFQDELTGRGAVVYHRFDGHLGLIKLSDEVGTHQRH